jgi:hypothetical protein
MSLEELISACYKPIKIIKTRYLGIVWRIDAVEVSLCSFGSRNSGKSGA